MKQGTYWWVFTLISGMAYSLYGQVSTHPTDPFFHSPFEEAVFKRFVSQHPADPLALLLGNDPSVDSATYTRMAGKLQRYAQRLARKRSNLADDRAFLRYFFFRTQRAYFGRYQGCQPFTRLLREGVYNCLSGTALYAWLLGELRIDYTLYETPYHVYLIARTADGEAFLLESTGKEEGFITGDRVEERERQYAQPTERNWCSKAMLCTPENAGKCPSSFRMTRTLPQLAALQYHNQAVALYNRRDWNGARRQLRKAALLDPDARRIRGLASQLQIAPIAGRFKGTTASH